MSTLRIRGIRRFLLLASLFVVTLAGWLCTSRADAQLAGIAGNIKEVVFAVREPKGPHWYENFGYERRDTGLKVSWPAGQAVQAQSHNRQNGGAAG